MSNSFMFSAEPRALVAGKSSSRNVSATQTLRSTVKAKYRQPEEQKEQLHLSLMSDPRVYRGTNYTARSPLLITQAAATSPALHSLPTALRDQSGLPLAYSPNLTLPAPSQPATARKPAKPMFVRPVTPPPVENRQHLAVQTEPYYHDLRTNPHRFTAATTQTDAELDYDTAVLFVPRSSGDDVGTEVDLAAIADFDRDVQVVVDVMVERALVDGLMETGEEEEEREVRRWRAEWEEKMAVEVNKLNSAISTHNRKQTEKQTRIDQRTQRRQQIEHDTQQRRLAAQAELEAAHAADEQRRREEAARPDPVVVEVTTAFVPWLMGEVERRVGEFEGSRRAVDGLLRSAVGAVDEHKRVAREERKQAEFDAYVNARYNSQPLPATSLATRAEDSNQQTYRFLQALNHQKAKLNPAAADSQRGSPEDEALRRIRAREDALRQQHKFHADVVRIQSLARARRDRRRVAKLRARRELTQSRKSMQPKELLKSLKVNLGMAVADWVVMEPAAEVKEGDVPATEQPSAAGLVPPTESVTTSRPATSSASASTPASAATLAPPTESPAVSRPTTATVSATPSVSASTTVSRPTTAGGSAIRPTAGVQVLSVELSGPTIQAGLHVGDIITHIIKTPITSTADYNSALATLTPGDAVTLTVYRSLSQRTEVLTIEVHSDEPAEYGVDEVRRLRKEAGMKAVDTLPLTADTARAEVEAMGSKVGFTPAKRPGKDKLGVLVTKLVAGSNAERCGLREGDVLVRAGSTNVASVDEFKEVSGGWLAGDSVLMRVVRGEGEAAEEVKVWVEIGAGTLPKKNTIEYVRAVRRIAGMKVAK